MLFIVVVQLLQKGNFCLDPYGRGPYFQVSSRMSSFYYLNCNLITSNLLRKLSILMSLSLTEYLQGTYCLLKQRKRRRNTTELWRVVDKLTTIFENEKYSQANIEPVLSDENQGNWLSCQLMNPHIKV